MPFKLFLTITCLLLFSTILKSQQSRQHGYVILDSGQKLSGKIFDENFHQNYLKVRFLADGDTAIRTYKPFEVTEYKTDKGFVFKSTVFLLDHGIKGEVFLEHLLQGKMSLYRFLNKFYVKKGEGEYIRLEDEKRIDYVEGKRLTETVYIKQLNELMADCPWIPNRVRKTNYHYKSLIKLIDLYNSCEGLAYDPNTLKKPYSLLVAAFGGVHSSTLKIQTTDYDNTAYSGNFKSSVDVYPGIYIQYGMPRLSERIHLITGISYTSDIHQNYVEFNNQGVVNRYDIGLESNQLNIPLGALFYIDRSAVSLYVGGGFSWSIITSSNSFFIHETEFNNQVNTTEQRPFAISNGLFGGWLFVGAEMELDSNYRLFAEMKFTRQFTPVTRDIFQNSAFNIVSLNTGIKILLK